MNVDEAKTRMQEIQRIMERATLFTLLPGAPAVLGGLLVLVGCAISYAMFRSLDFADILGLSFRRRNLNPPMRGSPRPARWVATTVASRRSMDSSIFMGPFSVT